jgi:hypothetical protein
MNELVNILRQLIGHRVALVSIASLMILGLASIASATTVTETKVGVAHDAELRTGEKLLIAEHRNPESYRICIPDMPGDVRLKVFHDGEVTEVLDGTCETVTAKHIDLKVDSKLPPGDALGLKIQTVKG